MNTIAIPGDVGIADVSIFRDGYAVVRVVKAADLGKMWTIEALERHWDCAGLDWSQPKKRKITKWLPIDADQAELVAARLREAMNVFRQEELEITRKYHAGIVELGARSYTP